MNRNSSKYSPIIFDTRGPIPKDSLILTIVGQSVTRSWKIIIPNQEVLDFHRLWVEGKFRYEPTQITIDGTHATSPLLSITGLATFCILDTVNLVSLTHLVNLPLLRNLSRNTMLFNPRVSLSITSCNPNIDLSPLVHSRVNKLTITDSTINCLYIWETLDRNISLKNSHFHNVVTPVHDHPIGNYESWFSFHNCTFPASMGMQTTQKLQFVPLLPICRELRFILTNSMFPLIRNTTHHVVGDALKSEYLFRPDPVADPYVMTEIDNPVIASMLLCSNVSRRCLEFIIYK